MALADAKGLFRCVSAHDVISCLLPEILRTGASYRSARRATHVDCFVSHSWSSPRWMKILAICHHLNLGLATVSSAMMSVLTWHKCLKFNFTHIWCSGRWVCSFWHIFSDTSVEAKHSGSTKCALIKSMHWSKSKPFEQFQLLGF